MNKLRGHSSKSRKWHLLASGLPTCKPYRSDKYRYFSICFVYIVHRYLFYPLYIAKVWGHGAKGEWKNNWKAIYVMWKGIEKGLVDRKENKIFYLKRNYRSCDTKSSHERIMVFSKCFVDWEFLFLFYLKMPSFSEVEMKEAGII